MRLGVVALALGLTACAESPTPPRQRPALPTASINSTYSSTGTPLTDLIAWPLTPHYALSLNAAATVVGWEGPHGYTWTRQGGLHYLDTGSEWSAPADINDRGDVIGNAWSPGLDQSAILWLSDGSLVRLGTFADYEPEHTFSMAKAINNRRQVVGQSDADGFVWTEATGLVKLAHLFSLTAAWDINDRGQMVGSSQISPPDLFEVHATLWSDARHVTDIGPSGVNSIAFAINNRGDVAMTSVTKATFPHDRVCNPGTPAFDESCRAYLWTKAAGRVAIPTLGGAANAAYAINDLGEVVGWSLTATNQVHAFLRTAAGSIVDLGALEELPDGPSVAYGINNRGLVVGYATGRYNGEHAVIWQTR